jgi:hypothetical protein
MAQTANAQQVYEGQLFGNSLPIKASTEIFLGAPVGLTAGYGRQLVAGDTFVGFADQHVNNAVATDGAARVPTIYRGLVKLTITGVAVTDVGKDVYASDDSTYTLVVGANSFIGKVHRWAATDTAIVAFNTAA